MNWPEGRRGKNLAGAYLIVFVVGAIGLLWTLVNQATGGSGAPMTVSIILFLVGQAGIYALAHGLRAGVANRTGTSNGSTVQRAWQRLATGLELPNAWRHLTN